jgi:hypothetical protein
MAMDGWVETELAECHFPDFRLKARLGQLLTTLGHRIGGTTPASCQDWAATKAAYRFYDNPRIDDQTILAGHFAATAARASQAPGLLLVLHDTTEFSFRRSTPDGIGSLSLLKGRHATHTVCGVLLHSSLVVTADGLPLGLAAAKFWTRKAFKGTNARNKRINATRVPIEEKESVHWLATLSAATERLGDPSRCLHIGDRGGDIFEWFGAADAAHTRFLVRIHANRRAGRGDTTIEAKLAREPVGGTHTLEVRGAQGDLTTAKLTIRVLTTTIHPPVGKARRYPALTLTVIEARERSRPKGREPIHWKLVTNMPVPDLATAIQMLDWYSLRWKIEMYHKVLKSGCKTEQSKLRTAERLINLLAVQCVVGWRVFWLTMMNRTDPEVRAESAFTPEEIAILHRLSRESESPRTLAAFIGLLAKLGGYLARAHDPPPGTMVIWRGLIRLTDIQLGFQLKRQLMGN